MKLVPITKDSLLQLSFLVSVPILPLMLTRIAVEDLMGPVFAGPLLITGPTTRPGPAGIREILYPVFSASQAGVEVFRNGTAAVLRRTGSNGNTSRLTITGYEN